jgi:hypothetical protein
MSDLIQSKAWPRAYSDDEVATPPNDGQVYYNVTDKEYKVWYDGIWQSMSLGAPKPWPAIPMGWQPPSDWPDIKSICDTNILPWPLHYRVNIGATISGAVQVSGWTDDIPMVSSGYGLNGSLIPTTNPINLLTAANPAPDGVYRSAYWAISYGTQYIAINNLNPIYRYTVRLHFLGYGTDPTVVMIDISVNQSQLFTNWSPTATIMNEPSYNPAINNAVSLDIPDQYPYTGSLAGPTTVTNGIYVWVSKGSLSQYGPNLFGVEIICQSPTYALRSAVPAAAGMVLTDSTSVINCPSSFGDTYQNNTPGQKLGYDYYFSDGNAILKSDYVGNDAVWSYNPDPAKDYVSQNDTNCRAMVLASQWSFIDLWPLDPGVIYLYLNRLLNYNNPNYSTNTRAYVLGPSGQYNTNASLYGNTFNSVYSIFRIDTAGALYFNSYGVRNCLALAFLNWITASYYYTMAIGIMTWGGQTGFENVLGLQEFISSAPNFSIFPIYGGNPINTTFTGTTTITMVVPTNWVPYTTAYGSTSANPMDLSSAPNMSIYSLAQLINNAGPPSVWPAGLSGTPTIIFGASNLAKVPQSLLNSLTAKGWIYS